jgi:serine/threonine protein phosphatase PrpC
MKPTSARLAVVSAASVRGARPYQEDRAVHAWIEKKGWLLAVFDGHRGAATAEIASKTVVSAFKSAWQDTHGHVTEALRETVLALTRLTREDLPGSTASLVFIPESAQEASWAVLGDSPIAIMDSAGRFHFGADHNVRSNLKERAAAIARGGIYREGYLEDPELPDLGLQMGRTLGDADLSRVLSREPDIETAPLGEHGIVLVGTDGLLSPGAGAVSEQLVRLLHMIRQGADAEALVQDALRRQTGDNVTAIVWAKSAQGQSGCKKT